MKSVVELPGEAAPLNAELLSQALLSAVSSQQLNIQSGIKQLQTWEKQRGYFSLLQDLYLEKSLPTEVRYLAIIQLKNGIDKYWRRSATAIVAEEKTLIRSRLLEGCISEDEKNLALQNALLVSKVVRIDYPNEWPQVLPNLISILRDSRHSNQLHLKRGILMLLQLVKELASARLKAFRAKSTMITEELIFLLSEIYVENVTLWTSNSMEQTTNIAEAMECSLLTIKTLRRLVIIGYEYPNHSVDAQRLWEYSKIQFGLQLKIISSQSSHLASSLKIMIKDNLLQLSKLHVTMAQQHPAAFALLPNSVELVRAYWGLVNDYGVTYCSERPEFCARSSQSVETVDDKLLMEKLCLKGLIILRACVKMVFNPTKSFMYKTNDIKAEQKRAVELIRTELLNNTLVQQIANLIVTKLFILRQIDLEAWEEDPEEWQIREECADASGYWDIEIRSCSEKLFTDLAINYKHILLNPLISYFNSVSDLGSGQENIIPKDAIYAAMGLSAPILSETFDFNSFLASTLVNETQKTGPGFKILRRRIAILIGQWITVNVSNESRATVYQIFQHLLKAEEETNDRVVHITAARRFKYVVEDLSFNSVNFIPYAPGILGRIMELAGEVESIEIKIAILDTIRCIINRLEAHILPFADQIVSMLATLWEEAGKEYVLKQSIFAILSTIVTSLQAASDRYYPLIIPLIANSISPESETKVYLLEDALDLWLNIIETTSSTTYPDILSLADAIFPLLEIGSDDLRNVLQILDTYCILAPQHMLSEAYRLRILSYMNSLLGVSKRELAGLVTTIVENLIRAADKFGGSQGVTLITHDLHSSGYLRQVFAGLRDAWEAHQTYGPNQTYPKIDTLVETDYFTILARLAAADPFIFADMLSSFGQLDEVWSWLSMEWFRHFDCIANVERRKLSCIALTRMLELIHPTLNMVLANLQDYFSIWTQTISELICGNEDVSDSLVWKSNEVIEGANLDTIRRHEWAMADIVHKISLWEFTEKKIAHVIEACGGETKFMEEWLINVDESILKDYHALGMNLNQC
ncbi:hypothetical protein Golomagni_03329 [Golovinomyces magnicellulatus]|nr:hypothetical protein Golomagni_03329 [Golovinomyces magnicellulatus]